MIGHFASGVTVITTRYDGSDFGATASAVTSLSLDPPMLLVCLNLRGRTQQAVWSSKVFGLSILDEDQGHLADRFAAPRGLPFAGLEVHRGSSGVPVLADALAFCECRVVDAVEAGTHRVFVAQVAHAVAREGRPLAYFRGTFGRFATERDATIYAELRRRILTRELPLREPLHLPALADQFDVQVGSVHHAVTRLLADGLIDRDPACGYVVRPITAASVEQEYDARCAMELGAVAATIGRIPREQLRGLRARMADTQSLLDDGRVADADSYARRTQAFHTAIIDLADNTSLSEAYRRLGFSGITLSMLPDGSPVGQDIADDHLSIVEAYEAADLRAALAAVERHNENVKETIRRAVAAGGGRL